MVRKATMQVNGIPTGPCQSLAAAPSLFPIVWHAHARSRPI